MTHTLRNELKYQIPLKQKATLCQRLYPILKLDPHSSKEGYWVKSVYFDDMHEKALNDNLDGCPYRSKFRIRYYNSDTNYICLEKKVKILNKGYKESICLTKNEVEKILNKEYEWMLETQKGLLIELYSEIKNSGLIPKTIINYQRIPFLFNAGNIRITLDFNIQSSNHIHQFLDSNLTYVPHSQDTCLLEVKYDEFIPDFIKNLIQIPESSWTSHSKYVQGRLIQYR